MKTKSLIAAVTLFAAAGAALADDTYPYVDHSKFVSTKTRAEVIAELNQARANGQVAANTEVVEFNNFVSTKTRAQVLAELNQARTNGELANNSEFVEFKNFASTRTRDEVRKEAIEAAKLNQGNHSSSVQ